MAALKKFVSKAKQRQAKRRKKISKFVKERPQRVAARQARKTAVVTARQKGKRARAAARQETRQFKDSFKEESKLQEVGFDPVTGQIDESFLSDTFQGGGGGAMDAFADFDTEGAITDKVWFWPAVIGGVGLLLFMNKNKKKG